MKLYGSELCCREVVKGCLSAKVGDVARRIDKGTKDLC